MLDLSIIIVTWNCKDYVLDCLHSIYKHPVSSSFEIIIVDNNSSDNSVTEIQKHYPHIRILQNKENKGFAVANNQGIALSSSKYVLLLNPDTLVHKNALDVMIEYIESDTSFGALGPKILNADGTQQFTGIRFPTNFNLLCETIFLDRLFPRSSIFGRHKALFEDYTKPFTIDYAQGSALLIRRTVLDTIGLLDEQFFMYFEETDLCFRIKQSGRKIMYFPNASITHFGGNEEGHFTEKRLLYYHKSLFQFYRKHYSLADKNILKIIVFLRSLLRIIVWCLLLVVKPQISSRVKSIIRGYLKTFNLIFE